MALIERLRQNRGNLRVEPQNFADWSRGSRFYPLLYMLTRVYGARDLGFGIELKKGLLGGKYQLELHHIFPKAQLKKHGYETRKEVHALANFTILTNDTNAAISDSLPEDYFPEYEAKHPGVLASHWIPMDRDLWKVENYRDFLAARRELLAKAANDFLDQLRHGTIPETEAVESIFDRETRPRPASIASDEEEAALNEAMDWMERRGLPRGEYGYELVNSDHIVVAVLDLAWPRGVQEGRGDKTALLIDEGEETLKIASREDYRCFTNLAHFQRYVQNDILGE